MNEDAGHTLRILSNHRVVGTFAYPPARIWSAVMVVTGAGPSLLTRGIREPSTVTTSIPSELPLALGSAGSVCAHAAPASAMRLQPVKMPSLCMPPIFIAPILWLIKVTVGKRKIAGYLQDRSFPAGKPTMPQTIHPPRDDKAAAERFRTAAERFVKYDGPIHPSPLFGAMTKDVAEQLQRVHCAHHLSFLVPKA